ncbi:hypothetical protein E1176_09265 [Fulvivirga sp. RKSG066]|uniref:SEC-C metal-binding domain-containing protein n=1 Tax=Fulvivirga aurantia TaxID=2529383 RepID=UPI0012BD6C0C|nr:SEC-C metal-binding domain-containing protein [Fulvivirga aurantia]MTI21207.1 hypothetical protein [Fulvivirga aurantia]
MSEVGRNEPCPCGSGKKYKNCHQKMETQKGARNRTYLIGLILLVFVLIAIANFVIDMNNRGNVTKPDGPAPAGKVWSEEHGHYH